MGCCFYEFVSHEAFGLVLVLCRHQNFRSWAWAPISLFTSSFNGGLAIAWFMDNLEGSVCTRVSFVMLRHSSFRVRVIGA